MSNHHGFRSGPNFYYRKIKRFKHRAETFRDESKTPEEKVAWEAVISWFDSILRNERCITPTGAIGLHPLVIDL
jgi:hypothetical protein